ncbi:MAG: integral rane sensor signal transduction histidine kinase [Frankiales bacterium]|nr:integral rane sensor signal transduction histidine kinase [Frankiales bacterium]
MTEQIQELTRTQRLRTVSVSKAVAAFLAAGLLVVMLIALFLALSQHRTATAEAIRDARTLTNLEAVDVIGPALRDDALSNGPGRAALDQVVRERVLGSHIVRVKIWDATGTIVYSDDAALIGMHFQLAADELAVLQSGRTAAEVSQLDAAENRDEQQFGKLLQVYQGIKTPTGVPLLFETYQPYTVISDASRRMWLSSLPVLVLGLVLLYLIQAPLAYRMARQLKRSQDEREALLLGSLAASDRERARIASDLHDGVVQGLAGASFSLTAGAARSRLKDPEGAQTMAVAAADLRRWVRELRSLVVTITPPALHAQGLGVSLADLASTLEGRGITVTLRVEDAENLDETAETLLYRAAQEAVRNVARHSDARHVVITLGRERGSGSQARSDELVLRVRDDGRGFDADGQAARRRGSVGLELLAGLVASHGGLLRLGAAPGGGAELTVHVPVLPATGSETPDRPVLGRLSRSSRSSYGEGDVGVRSASTEGAVSDDRPPVARPSRRRG